MSDIKYDFFMSQISPIRDIKEDEKVKISVVFYEAMQAPCVLKVCKNRDMTEMYQKLIHIRQPNIVTVYDVIYANQNTYVIEEFVGGRTLHELLGEHGNFNEKETAKMIIDVCSGLEVLHGCQPPIIHNDIKTSNIMVREDGTMKLIDFDIARTYKEGAAKNTKLMGTEEYAAPEHFGFGQSEPCTDVYSLGVTMHELLTGCGLTNERKMMYRGSLQKIVKCCIEVDREKRYSSAKQLKKELERFLKKKKLLLPLWITLLLLLVLGAMFGVSRLKQAEQPEKTKENSSNLQDENEVNDTDDINQNEIGNDSGSNDGNIEETNGQESASVSTQNGTQGNNKEVIDEKEEQNEQQNKQEENNDGNTTPTILPSEKKMTTVCSVTGTIHTTVAIPDFGFVTLERLSGKYYIKTSSGKEKALNGVVGSYGCRLVYNGYDDKSYLLEYNNNSTKIFTIDKNLNIEQKATFSGGYYIDKSHLACNFFSDGTMLCNPLFKKISCNNWTLMESVPGSSYVIADKLYKRGSSAFFEEVDMAGNVLKKYDGEFFANVYHDQIYVTKNCAYFIGTVSNKEYLYCFDGTSYKRVACLNDYQSYVKTPYSYLSVSDDAFRYYDTSNKVIKEFKLK